MWITPGEESQNLKGGIAWGTLLRGVIKLGEVVEIHLGNIVKDGNGDIKITKIFTRIVSLRAEKNNLIYVIPGGLIGVGLKINPYLTRENSLVWRILGHPRKITDIFSKVDVRCHLFRILLGERLKEGNRNLEQVGELRRQENLLLKIGSISVVGKVFKINGDN